MADDLKTTALELLEAKTLEIVARDGRDRSCAGEGCRMVGKKCPSSWCEVVYQNVQRSMKDD